MKLDYVHRPSRVAGVVGYTGFCERTDGPLARREPPAGCVHLILSFGPRIRLLPEDATRRSFVVGMADRVGFYAHDGEQDGVEIRLTPPAARRLLNIPLAELTNEVVEVEDTYAECLHELPDWDARFAALDAALARRLADAPPLRSELEWAWRRIAATQGRARVGDLAAELGYSRRHLTASFRRELGLPPKALARVLRFERARALLEGGSALADIAYDCGYYDQAHLNRDFRDLAGVSPTELLATRIPDGGLVAFVQDEGVRAA
jgi:AraC-like DNA-binding protein